MISWNNFFNRDTLLEFNAKNLQEIEWYGKYRALPMDPVKMRFKKDGSIEGISHAQWRFEDGVVRIRFLLGGDIAVLSGFILKDGRLHLHDIKQNLAVQKYSYQEYIDKVFYFLILSWLIGIFLLPEHLPLRLHSHRATFRILLSTAGIVFALFSFFRFSPVHLLKLDDSNLALCSTDSKILQFCDVSGVFQRLRSDFQLRPGLAGNDSVSLEWQHEAGRFVTVSEGKISIEARQYSELFERQASFVIKRKTEQPELFVLEPLDAPDFAFIKDGQQLYLAPKNKMQSSEEMVYLKKETILISMQELLLMLAFFWGLIVPALILYKPNLYQWFASSWRPYLFGPGMFGLFCILLDSIIPPELSVWTRGFLITAMSTILGLTFYAYVQFVSAMIAPAPDSLPEADFKFSNLEYIKRYAYLAVGFVFIIFAFVWIQLRQPYFFTQDDNLAQFLPVILNACQDFFNGVFSQYNPYSMHGLPSASVGVYALTYPITYLCYGIAHYFLGDTYAWMEVFALFHILLGYGSMYLLIQRLIHRPGISASAGLAFVLCGYTLIAGRSWFYMLPLLVYLPLILYFITGFWQTRVSSIRNFLGISISVALLFHAGNAQMWVYTLLLSGIYIIFRIIIQWPGWSRITLLGFCFIAGLILCLPLILVQMQTIDVSGRVPWGSGIYKGVSSIFYSYPFAISKHPNSWGNTNIDTMGHLYFFATPFSWMILMILGGFGMILFSRPLNENKLSRVFIGIWVVLGLLGFDAALGLNGELWMQMQKIPILQSFTNPFKFLPIMIGSFVIAVSYVLNAAVRRNLMLETGLFIATIASLSLMLFFPQPSFFSYGVRPSDISIATQTNPLIHYLQSKAGTSRIYSTVPSRSEDPDYLTGLQSNFSLFWRLPSLSGYDTFKAVPEYRNLVELQQKGVGFIISEIDRQHGVSKEFLQLPVVLSYRGYDLRKVPDPLPLAFWKSSGVPIKKHLHGGGINLNIQMPDPNHTKPMPAYPNDERTLVVNFKNLSFMRVYFYGQELPARTDLYGRIEFELPQTWQAIAKSNSVYQNQVVNRGQPEATVQIRYEAPWFWPLISALVSYLLLLVLLITQRKRFSSDELPNIELA